MADGRVKFTPEHPLLGRRGDDFGFASAERVETISIHVPGTNVFLADGAWVHNDMPLPQTLLRSSSGSGSSGSRASGSSGGEKASGSSWASP